MDGRCVYLFLSIFIINLLSVTNGKKFYVEDSLKVKPFDNRLQSKKLEKIVIDVLTLKYNKRKMIDVPKPYHKLYMVWRGIRTFFAEKMLYIFCPSLLNELKAVRALKEMVSNNKRIQKQLNFILPFEKSKSIKIKKDKTSNKGKKDSASDEESYEEISEESEEDSDENSSEDSDVKDKKKKPVKKGEKSETKDDDDYSDSDSDEDSSEEGGKKKKRKKNLDDLFQ